MGWTIPTYSGTKATGKPSGYRIAMFELIRAINERRTAEGHALIGWQTADGFGAFEPTIGDLEDLPTGNGSAAWSNMIAIQSYVRGKMAIGDTVGSVISGYRTYYGALWKPDLATPWTTSLMESDIGASIADPPTKYNDARWWQAMQDALDRMTIVTKDPGLKSAFPYDGFSLPVGSTASNAYSSGASAWTNRNERTTTFDAISGSLLARVGWYVKSQTWGFPFFGYGHVTTMLRSGSMIAPITALWQGNIVKSEIYSKHSQSMYTDGPFSVSVAGSSFSFSGTAEKTIATTAFNVGSTPPIPMSISQTEPSYNPFTVGTSPSVSSATCNIIQHAKNYPEPPRTYMEPSGTGSATCWLDMSSVLTDQT